MPAFFVLFLVFTIMNRKRFLTTTLLGAATIPEILAAIPAMPPLPVNDVPGMKICVFSKCLHWLGYDDMALFVKQLGFDGIDLTVRKGGHVLPENVTTDLSKAVAAAEKAGLKIYMITTDINDADEPHTEAVIKTAASLGIKYYRTNWYKYDPSIDVTANLQVFKKRLGGLGALNKKYGIEAAYQNHAGDLFGAPVWDLWEVIKDIDGVSCQYDVRHAVAESASSWATAFRLIHPKVNTIAIKDLTWQPKDGKLQAQSVPLGTGAVNYPEYIKMLNQYRISGPATMHFEYPLGGAEDGANKMSITKEEFAAAVSRDLKRFKALLA